MDNGAIVVGRLDNFIIRMMNMYDANRHRFYCVLATVNLIWVVLLLGGSVPILYFLPYSEQVKFIAFMSYFVVVIIAFAVIQVISYQYIERMALTRERDYASIQDTETLLLETARSSFVNPHHQSPHPRTNNL
ncbi:unnamed protein product [Caenorhabditis brenneri]